MHFAYTTDFFNLMYSALISHAAPAVEKQPRLTPLSSPILSDDTLPRNTHFDAFERLADATCRRMEGRAAHKNTLAPEHASRLSLNGKMQLNAHEWHLRSDGLVIANLRMVHIQGPKNEIINTWVFPNFPNQAPVYAAELIAVAGSVKIAFVDIQVPVATYSLLLETEQVTSALASRFAHLPCDEAAPTWATDASPGHFTYARNLSREHTPTVEECYLAYLDAYLNIFVAPDAAWQPNDGVSNAAIRVLSEYQWHHMEHSPGQYFLSKLFGADWTSAFMQRFLFAEPRG